MLPQPQPPLSAASPPPSLNPSTAYTNTLKTVEELTNEVTRLRIQVKGLERASQIKEHGYEQQIETLKKVISIIEIERDEYRELLEASVYAPPSDESGTLSPTSVKAESQDDTVTANPVPESKPPTVSLEVRPSKDMLPAAPISAADAGLDLKRHPSSSMGPQAKRVQSQKLNGA